MPSLIPIENHIVGDVFTLPMWQEIQGDLNYIIQAGADLASAATIFITNEAHGITGTTTIDNITHAAPVDGQQARLRIKNGPLTFRNNGGGTGNIRTVSGADRLARPQEVLIFEYDTAGTVWRLLDQAIVTLRKSTPKAVNTSIVATDLFNGEFTIPGGALGVTGKARGTVNGDWLQNVSAALAIPRFQLVFGGTTVIDTGANSRLAGQSATRSMWRLIFEITNTAINAQDIALLLEIAAIGGGTPAVTTFTTGTGYFDTGDGNANMRNYAKGYNTSALDTTTAKTLVLNVINGNAGALYETKLFDALVEII